MLCHQVSTPRVHQVRQRLKNDPLSSKFHSIRENVNGGSLVFCTLVQELSKFLWPSLLVNVSRELAEQMIATTLQSS